MFGQFAVVLPEIAGTGDACGMGDVGLKNEKSNVKG
jgi:hypothetical protein